MSRKEIKCCAPKFAVEVHLPLILRISAQNSHCDAINPIKKFVKVVSVKLSKVDETPLLRYIFFGCFHFTRHIFLQRPKRFRTCFQLSSRITKQD